MASTTSEPQSIQWDFIVDKILAQQCVLVLGPEVYTVKEHGQSCQAALLEHLDVEQNPNIYRYYPQDEFFLFDESYKRTLVCHQIKSFYQVQEANEHLLKLARLPFHFYLTVTPDVLLQKAFDAQNFNYQSGYYKRNKEPQVIKPPSKNLPLIYNAFGSVQSEESIILSHDDLYDYFKSIFAQQSMPERLKLQLREVKNFIFLGVSFEKWYMQLLMRELEIHNRQYEFTRFAASQNMSKDLTTFCVDQFQIQFISNNIQQFIDTLLAHFPEAALRQPEGESSSGAARAKMLVRKGELGTAIEEMEDCTDGTSLEDEIAQLSGRYGKFQRRVRNGILRSEEKLVQENTLSSDLLNLISEAQQLGL